VEASEIEPRDAVAGLTIWQWAVALALAVRSDPQRAVGRRRGQMSTRILAVAVTAALQLTLIVEAAHAGGTAVPVPEPTTLALLGAGAAVVAVGAWWKHRK
jgi:hypothetical protein